MSAFKHILAQLRRQEVSLTVGFQKDGALVFQNLSPLTCSLAWIWSRFRLESYLAWTAIP